MKLRVRRRRNTCTVVWRVTRACCATAAQPPRGRAGNGTLTFNVSREWAGLRDVSAITLQDIDV